MKACRLSGFVLPLVVIMDGSSYVLGSQCMSTTKADVPSNAKTSLPKHLRLLEAESIEIMREVVAEFKNPVMLYSIGKNSSVMLHLA